MRAAALLLLPLSLALAACSPGGEGEQAQQQPDSPVAVDKLKHLVDLEAVGLSVPPQAGDEQMDVPFGSRRAAAEATLASVLGEVLETGANAECPAGPVETTSYEGLTLNYQEGVFVGWMATAPYLPPQGRRELAGRDDLTLVEDSTLGEEFAIGDPAALSISGLFDGAGDDARVARMWAGVNCIFR